MLAATLSYRGRKFCSSQFFLGGRHEKDEHDRSDSNWSGHTRRSAYFASSIPRKRLVTVRGQCLRRDRATPNTRQCCWRQSESASTGVSASLLRLPLLSVQSDSVVKRFCPEPVVLIGPLPRALQNLKWRPPTNVIGTASHARLTLPSTTVAT